MLNTRTYASCAVESDNYNHDFCFCCTMQLNLAELEPSTPPPSREGRISHMKLKCHCQLFEASTTIFNPEVQLQYDVNGQVDSHIFCKETYTAVIYVPGYMNQHWDLRRISTRLKWWPKIVTLRLWWFKILAWILTNQCCSCQLVLVSSTGSDFGVQQWSKNSKLKSTLH